MLIVPSKHGILLTENSLEMTRCVNITWFVPKLIEKPSILGRQLTLSSKWIIVINFLSKMLVKEVFSERPSITKTLKSAVHKACVTKVSEPDHASLCILFSLHFHCLCIDHEFCTTFVEMITFIIFLASFRAILYFFACTSDLENLGLVTALALSNLTRVFVILKNEGTIVGFNLDNK